MKNRARGLDPRIAVAGMVLFGSCGVAAYRGGVFSQAPIRPSGAVLTRNDKAPEFEGLTRWFNSPPLTLASLRGKVVLIDFWTYTCINCIRTFPELRNLYRTYKAAGLEIVGVHAPEFGFEKVSSNVERAVKEKQVLWPVAQDNDHRTWDAFRNHYWPHVYLIDHRGRIRFDQIGEGGSRRIEAAVRRLLADAGATLPPPTTADVEGPSEGITPEIYLGYERGERFLGNDSGYTRDAVAGYVLPREDGIAGRDAAFFLEGRWRALREAVVASEPGARLILPFTARDVFVVAGRDAPEPVVVDVLLDGKPISPALAGADVRNATLRLDGRDLYRIVRLKGVEPHELTMRPRGSGAAFYSFTFG